MPRSRCYTDEPAIERRHRLRPAATDDALSLFAPVAATPTRVLVGMVRGTDPVTSQRAAVDVLPKRAWIKRAILEAIATEGPKTAGELENRHEFAYLGVSTVRKRVSELFHDGRLVRAGLRDRMALWDLAPNAPISGS